jgi:1,4-dihydroxy-2-naphthoate octaprenyltransferase
VRLVRAARLLLGMTLTCLVTAGSMLINDYHDHKLGVDNAKVITTDEP